jgi:hypothetical protein
MFTINEEMFFFLRFARLRKILYAPTKMMKITNAVRYKKPLPFLIVVYRETITPASEVKEI